MLKDKLDHERSKFEHETRIMESKIEELEREKELNKQKNANDEKAAKRKGFIEFIKSAPQLITSAIALVVVLFKLLSPVKFIP